MKVEIFPDEAEVARQAARIIAAEARAVIAARDGFVLAVSGGRTPWVMLRALAEEQLAWEKMHIVQVDERVAPAGHADRNLTHLQESLQKPLASHPDLIQAMPVDETDLQAAAARYATTLRQWSGSPPALDLVHLGLGPDGHTASLVPGDPVLEIVDVDVALTNIYQGRQRMTLTYPILNRARRILWVITGSEKAVALARLQAGDPSIPAGRVRRDQALVVADQAAAEQIKQH